DVFISKFKIEVTLHTANLIVDYWKYFFSIAFFEPINDLTFEEFVEYESLHSTFDNKYGKKWLWRKLADKVYIKSFDGDELLISSYTLNVKYFDNNLRNPPPLKHKSIFFLSTLAPLHKNL